MAIKTRNLAIANTYDVAKEKHNSRESKKRTV